MAHDFPSIGGDPLDERVGLPPYQTPRGTAATSRRCDPDPFPR